MLTPGQTKLEKFSDEEFERYGIFDDVGDIIGAKDDVPDEFREAYEHDKKMYDDAWKRGIEL